MSKATEPKASKRKRIPFRLEPEFIARVDMEARRARFSRQQMMEAIIKNHYGGLSPDERDAQIAHRLQQVDKRQKTLEDYLKIISEAQALFIRMWLSTNFEVPEEQRQALETQSRRRYERFLESLGRRIDNEETMLSEIHKGASAAGLG